MKKIIMMGPMPPAIGGMATVLDNLSKSELVNLCNVVFWNTAKETSNNRSLFSAIKVRLAIWYKFYNTLKKEQPDFVHIHTCSGFTTFFLDACFALIARWCDVPYFIHIHGATFDKFLESLPNIKLNFILGILKKSQNVIALTAEWQILFENDWDMKNVQVIVNGVPTVDFDRSLIKDNCHILYMGQICSRKGTKDLIKAFSLAKQDKVILHLAGDFGGDITQDEIEAYIQEFPSVINNIIVEGPVVGQRKQILMETCDIFCLPSYAEGLPMVVLEAMSYKQAVLTTDVGGLPGLITNEANGILTKPGDIDAISKGIVLLTQDDELKNKLAQEGHQTFVQKYSTSAIVKYYVQLYCD